MLSTEEPAAGKLHYSYIFKGLSRQRAKALQSRDSILYEMPECICKAAADAWLTTAFTATIPFSEQLGKCSTENMGHSSGRCTEKDDSIFMNVQVLGPGCPEDGAPGLQCVYQPPAYVQSSTCVQT